MGSSTERVKEAVPHVFEHLAAEPEIPALRGTSGVYEFDLEDEPSTWFLALDHGKPELRPGADHPDCIITCTAGDFVEIASGQQNIMTAFLQGRVRCAGNISLALDFRHLLPVTA